MIQSDFFDPDEGERRKKAGKELAAEKHAYVLSVAQRIVVAVARSRAMRQATADDAQAALRDAGYNSGDLGNAAGSIFRGALWERVGYTKSRRPSNHARVIGIWRLRNGAEYGL